MIGFKTSVDTLPYLAVLGCNTVCLVGCFPEPLKLQALAGPDPERRLLTRVSRMGKPAKLFQFLITDMT